MQNQLQNINSTQTMSSEEMSSLTGVRHDSVKRTIESLLSEAILLNTQIVETAYISGLGVKTPKTIYISDKRDSLVIVARLSPEFTGVVIDRWQELENNQPKPRALTMREMILYTLALEDEKERLQIELDQSKQWLTIKKVAAHNHINWKSLEWRKLKETSIVIGLLPKKIFDSNFPDGVNCYSKDAWRIVYPNLILPNGEI